MAGIGFELRRVLLAGPGVLRKLSALAAAAAVTSGPWLLTLLTLLLIDRLAPAELSADDRGTFQATVTYCFAFTLVLIGALQMPFTRHLADALFRGDTDELLPAFVAALAVAGPLLLLVGGGYCLLAGTEPLRTAAFLALFVAVGLNWLGLTWLTVLRRHGLILLAHGMGLLVAVLTAGPLARTHGVAGALLGIAAGQGLTFVLLAAAIARGTPRPARLSFDLWRAGRRWPSLLLIGVCYGLAIWSDKVVYWLAEGHRWGPWLQTHPVYDGASFLAYLTIVPALAINLIFLETRFHDRYRAYYGAILGGAPLAQIRWQREQMVATLRDGAILLLRCQGFVTALVIVFAPMLLSALGLHLPVKAFRLCCLGAFFHGLLLIVVLVLLYFDLRKVALVSSAMFLLANTVLPWACQRLQMGTELLGAGYAMAALGSLVLAFAQLSRALGRLEYLTFAPLVRQMLRG